MLQYIIYYRKNTATGHTDMKEFILALLKLLTNPIIFIPLVTAIAVYGIKTAVTLVFYSRSTYHRVTHLPYYSVILDTGRYGEYLTYKYLHKYERQGARLLFNLYLPKGENETSEIDLLMICKKGIFVFESKNYSGWIFGDEDKLYWYQTLPRGRHCKKERFYNPIMQNSTHIKCLDKCLENRIDAGVPINSVIVFSERCTLKKVTVRNGIRVINRNEICDTVNELCEKSSAVSLSAEKINEIYDILYPYSQVDADTKSQHIETIRAMTDRNDIPAVTSENSDVETAVAETISETAPAMTADAPERPAPSSSDESGNEAPTVAENSSDICPLCGGKLIVRSAKRGTNAGQLFWGCSNFPRCRYTKKL